MTKKYSQLMSMVNEERDVVQNIQKQCELDVRDQYCNTFLPLFMQPNL